MNHYDPSKLKTMALHEVTMIARAIEGTGGWTATGRDATIDQDGYMVSVIATHICDPVTHYLVRSLDEWERIKHDHVCTWLTEDQHADQNPSHHRPEAGDRQ